MTDSLSAEQEAQAQQLAHDLARAVHDELLQMARLLVAADTAALFGDTEFKVRDLALRIAARAYQQQLAEKKTATSAPA
jgi:hypothetical protein